MRCKGRCNRHPRDDLPRAGNNPQAGLESVFNKTRVSISRASDGAQVPTVSSTLVEDVSLGG